VSAEIRRFRHDGRDLLIIGCFMRIDHLGTVLTASARTDRW